MLRLIQVSIILPSVCVLLAGLFIHRAMPSNKAQQRVFGVLVFVNLMLLSFYLVSLLLTGHGINNAVIYHIQYGLVGAGFGEYWEAFIVAVILLFLSVFVPLWSIRLSALRGIATEKWYHAYPVACLFIICSLIMNPALYDIYKMFAVERASADFDEYYKKPVLVQTGRNDRNFIFIYAESLERTYFDENIFPGLITSLRKLESQSIHFTNIDSLDGTEWTMGGLTASLCGTPLYAPSHGNSLSGMDTFLSNATCVGDLLHDENYYLSYMGGAKLIFGGKGKFFATHKFDEIKGRDELSGFLPDAAYQHKWGLYDDTLFDLAYKHYLDLSAAGQKFGLFLLSLDTHHPRGHISKSCEGMEYADGKNRILNAVACSDYLIGKFVNRILTSSSFGERRPLVVIASDHLAMNNTAYAQLESGNRKNVFMIIDPEQNFSFVSDVPGSTLDYWPITLPFLGYKGELGFGRNLLSKDYKRREFEVISKNVASWKSEIIKIGWEFPSIHEYIEVNPEKGQLTIDQRSFGIPILVEIKENWGTVLRFQFDSVSVQKKLIDYVKDFSDETQYIWIDNCGVIQELRTEDFPAGRMCVAFGKGGKGWGISAEIESAQKYTLDDLSIIFNDKNSFN